MLFYKGTVNAIFVLLIDIGKRSTSNISKIQFNPDQNFLSLDQCQSTIFKTRFQIQRTRPINGSTFLINIQMGKTPS